MENIPKYLKERKIKCILCGGELKLIEKPYEMKDYEPVETIQMLGHECTKCQHFYPGIDNDVNFENRKRIRRNMVGKTRKEQAST